MSKTAYSQQAPDFEQEPAIEAIKRMIRYTKKESDKDGRTFCSYFLDMALQSLEDGSEDLDTMLKSKITPLMVGQAAAEQSSSRNS
ncbi:hypothetical protein E1180_21115 [Roseibium denhamense]|uniref:Uncharacterized protein n=1 Tax=Roseibium denhamense TaxID=76305 RepID=A0ABY1NQH7_9HYPH|nr:hypothetical protein [Roseibium denhamense]MTI08007.1 hypothetical protein [Roseibium denhamense]SMP15579.1 hypothetical protein SAMN06265374_1592 [Roseibium denhamense]